MSIASQITSIEEHIGNAYDGLEDLGVDLTNVDKNINNIKACLDNVYSAYPKVTGSGKEVVLSGTKKARMEVVPKGESEQESTTGRNKLNASPTEYTFSNTSGSERKDFGTVNLVANTKYFISYDIKNNSTSNTRNTPYLTIGTNTIYQDATENYNTTAGRKIWEFTPTTTGVYTFGYWAHTPNVPITISDFMISTSSDTSYEQYTGGIPAPNPDFPFPVVNVTGNNSVEVNSKNLFDNVWEEGSIDGATGQNSSNANLMRCKNYIPVEELTNYKFSTSNTSLSLVYVYEYKEDYSYNLSMNKGVALTDYLTTNAGTKFVRIRPANFTPDYSLKIQMELGTTATTYVPYSHQTKPLNLGSSKLMKNDYMSDDGIKHKRKKIVLNENSTIIQSSYSNIFYTDISYELGGKNYNINIKPLCNIFIGETYTTGASNMNSKPNNTIALLDLNYKRIYFNTNKFNTVDAFKTYLETTNCEIELELMEEETEAYTTEQQTQWNNLKQTNSYDDTTIITTTYSNAQADLTVSALKGA